jgi:hypothetical protein
MQLVDELQRLIEDLAQRLGRSVAVDDPALRLVACSSHFDDADQARLDSLVGRRVEGAMREHVLRSGITSWRGPGRISARPDLGTERDRVGFPLRSRRHELLGFMWILDDGSISDAEMNAAGDVAERVQDMLARRVMAQKDDQAELEAALLGLLSASSDDREAAARSLADVGLFPRATAFTVAAVQHASTGLRSADMDVDVEVVRHAIGMATLSRPQGSVAFAATDHDSLVVISGLRGASDLRSLAGALHKEITAADEALGARTTVGIGAPQDRLIDVGVSFDQAIMAARVARRRGDTAGLWGDDAPELLLEVVLRSSWENQLLPAVLSGLAGSQPTATLATVEAYLNNAGNVPATAEALHAHRSTIYYHLTKFQDTTGLDLDNGDTRLMVHLWFKLAGRSS